MATDIFDAIRAGDERRVSELLSANPELAGSRDADGLSLVLFARYRSDGPIIQAILAARPRLDAFDAAAVGDTGRLGDLLAADPGLATAWSTDGFTALHLAAFFGHLDAARLLLDAGADPDLRSHNEFAVMPLHSAVAGRHADLVGELLGRGADPNVRQRHGYTPLHAAAENADSRSVELLLAAGAATDLKMDDGRTPAQLAAAAGDAELASRLGAA